MVSPIIRGNGTVIYPKGAVLPKNTAKSEVYEGSVRVIEAFNQKSEVNQSDFQQELAPDRPFVETLDAINQDPRLNLALETYIQMVIGKGLKVTAKNKKTQKAIDEWFKEVGMQEIIEDGLYSYIGTGNLIYEKDPTGAEFVEVPITTMESIVRDDKGKIKYYVQRVNDKDIFLKPREVVHFKLTNVAREPFARGLFHSILTDYTDPRTGIVYDSPLIQMKEVEDNMVEIIKGHADPTVMFYFEDAGEQFIKTQADNLKKMKKGSKIVTDKKFETNIVEASGNSKFEGWIEHLQRDLLEPGSKFPLQFFNAGFTARAASESTDSVLIRKVKRIQERFANQFERLCLIPYLKKRKLNMDELNVFFETPLKQAETVQEVITAFRDNIIRRSEARKWIVSNTGIDIDQTDMEDEPPITSVTPTGQLRDDRSGQFGGPADGDSMDDGDTVTAKPKEEGYKKGRKKK